MHHPGPTKERVELTTLGITAIEIPHSTTLTLLLLLRIQRKMWRNHDAIWAYLKIASDRNLDLNKILLWICTIFCNINFGLDLDIKNLDHFIWKRLRKKTV